MSISGIKPVTSEQIDQVTYGHVSTAQVGSILQDFESQKGGKSKTAYRSADGRKVDGEIRIGLGSCCVATEAAGFALRLHLTAQPSLLPNKTDVTWSRVLFERS